MSTHEQPMTVEEAKRLIEAQDTLTIDEAKKIVAKKKRSDETIQGVIVLIVLWLLVSWLFFSGDDIKPVVIKNHGGYAGDQVYR